MLIPFMGFDRTLVPGKVTGSFKTASAQICADAAVGCERCKRIADSVDAIRINEEGRVSSDFRHRTDIRSQHRASALHRFKNWNSKTFMKGHEREPERAFEKFC